MHKDTKKLIKKIEEQGFTTSVTTKGHVRVFRDRRQVTTFSGTASDHRSIRNSLADLKRAGFTP